MITVQISPRPNRLPGFRVGHVENMPVVQNPTGMLVEANGVQLLPVSCGRWHVVEKHVVKRQSRIKIVRIEAAPFSQGWICRGALR